MLPEFEQGTQEHPDGPARKNKKSGQYGGKKAPPVGNSTKPPLKYDTATNSFRPFSKPSSKAVGQGTKLNGKGHDGKFGAPDGGHGRDGRVGGTGPTPQSDFKGSGGTYGGDSDGDADDIAPHNDFGSNAKVGQGSKLNGKGHKGQSGIKLRPSRVG